MICPKCKYEQPQGSLECVKCGIVFEKYLAHQKSLSPHRSNASTAHVEGVDDDENAATTVGYYIKAIFLHVKPSINPFYLAGRVIAFLIILIWGLKFIFAPMDSDYFWQSFLHPVNLVFHEAGHVLFRPLGHFMTMLGGSLAQLLMPLICFIVLLIKTRDTFGASVALWWLGQSLMDLAPYINDARARKLILLGGVTGRDVPGYHDWEFILQKLGWLKWDHVLGNTARGSGILLMAFAFGWGGYLLWKQYKNLETGIS